LRIQDHSLYFILISELSGSLNVPGVDFNVENVDKNFVGTFRRLSAAFEAMEAAEREANENSSDDEVKKCLK
jgi:hypothetical protein